MEVIIENIGVLLLIGAGIALVYSSDKATRWGGGLLLGGGVWTLLLNLYQRTKIEEVRFDMVLLAVLVVGIGGMFVVSVAQKMGQKTEPEQDPERLEQGDS